MGLAPRWQYDGGCQVTFWDWLYRVGPGWPSQRGWYALALCLQTSVIVVMLALYPELSKNEFFKVVANAVIVTGWVGYAVAGRDNTVDREQVGKAQDIAAKLLDQHRPGGAA